MQAELGGPLERNLIPVHFAYVARYEYSDIVVQNDNFLRLSPFNDRFQTPAEGCSLVATFPAGSSIAYPDRQGNLVNRIRITAPHQELVIAATGSVCLNDRVPVVADVPVAALDYGLDAREFLTASHLVDPDGVRDLARDVAAGADTLLGSVGSLIGWVHENIRYERGHTSVNTTSTDVLESRHGVCQDMTHLGAAMLRSQGIPARYVSGLLTRQPGETHAWLEFLHPQYGWLPADPTRGTTQLDGTDYLKFAVGRDYSEVPPVSGSFVSRGEGWLSFTRAEVFFDRNAVSVDDALELLNKF